MMYPEEVIEEVRTRNDIVAVVGQYVRLTKRGSNHFGVCPFHNEKTGSFSVSQSKQMYYCFGCGAGGNVITFVMEYENYTFTEALKYLADRAGVTLPEGEVSEEEKQRASLRARILEVNKEAAKYYYYQLKSPRGQNAWRYLTGRGLSEDTIRKFGLGYSLMYRDDLYQYLKKKGYRDELLSQSGLVKITEKGAGDRFWNRAMFPIMDVNSRVIGFGGRVMGEGEPKYLNSPETLLFDKSRNLYGLHLARSSRRPYFLICEGYMDVIAMHQAGFDCAVASLGTAFTQGHAMLIKRYVKDVVLTYDSDGAGVKAAMRAIPILKSVGISVRVLNMRPYKDPDEFIVHEGAEAFQKRIDEAINSFLFECDVIRGQYDLKDPEKKTEFHRQVASRLMEFPDELERRNYIEAVCARHQIPVDALDAMVRRMSARHPEESKNGRYGEDRVRYEDPEEPYGSDANTAEVDVGKRPQRRKKAREKDEGILETQRLLLNWALSGTDHVSKLSQYLSPEDFGDDLCRELAEVIWENGRIGRITEPASLMNRYLEEEEQRNKVAAVFNTTLPAGLEAEEEERVLAESVRRLMRISLDAAARRETDPGKLQQIIMNKAKLQSLRIRLH